MLPPRPDPLVRETAAGYAPIALAPTATRESQAVMRAEGLYRSASFAALVGRFLAWLTRRPDQLLDLALIPPAHVAGSSYKGLHPVPISSIIGSQGRAQDFDSAFNPLREHDRRRWVNLAALKLLGQSLPPVDLIQIGDVYFVADGHHRISIARALGQQSIDALVVAWHVTAPLPWDPSPSRPSDKPGAQPSAAGKRSAAPAH